ncbi:hypothetical protein K438DRAFT_1775781 [Mycena galopus ATCC 62051]|nr:hypothetical protein K438DRAFT_1775781 [Mycena galopus ATCC 62051]
MYNRKVMVSVSLSHQWAHHLAHDQQKRRKTKICSAVAVVCEDTVAQALFAQRCPRSPHQTHTIARLGQEPLAMTTDDANIFFSDFEQVKALFFQEGQNFSGLRDLISAFMEDKRNWSCVVLLAPWSPVKIQSHPLQQGGYRQMCIHAGRAIQKGEVLYELAGQLASDLESEISHTHLSQMKAWDKTTRILFGPIRWLNHHCNANTEASGNSGSFCLLNIVPVFSPKGFQPTRYHSLVLLSYLALKNQTAYSAPSLTNGE